MTVDKITTGSAAKMDSDEMNCGLKAASDWGRSAIQRYYSTVRQWLVLLNKDQVISVPAAQ